MVICSYTPLLDIWGPIDSHSHIFTIRVVGEQFQVDKYCQPMLIVGIYDVVRNSSRFASKQLKRQEEYYCRITAGNTGMTPIFRVILWPQA
jgi:hypothetical protein